MAQRITSLAIGSLVRFGSLHGVPIVWRIAAHNHVGYPNNSVTLVADKILKILPFDAVEATSENSSRAGTGNNRYAVSNIRQWLNSAAGASQWYSAQHASDAPPTAANVYKDGSGNAVNPYYDKPGFLNAFTATERGVLLDTALTVTRTTYDGGGTETVTDKVFLMSLAEIGLDSDSSHPKRFACFTDGDSREAYPTDECVANNNYSGLSVSYSRYYWLLRDPAVDATNTTKSVGTNGDTTYNQAAYQGFHGVRPACNLTSMISVEDSADADGVYTLIYNMAPTGPGTPKPSNTATEGQAWTNTWTASNDADGDAISYVPEWRMDSDSYRALSATSGNQATVQIPAAIRPGDSIPISWTAGEGAESYAIQRKINDGAWTNLVSGITRTNYTDVAPSSGRRFTLVYYRIASETEGSVATEYTEAGKPVCVYVEGGEE